RRVPAPPMALRVDLVPAESLHVLRGEAPERSIDRPQSRSHRPPLVVVVHLGCKPGAGAGVAELGDADRDPGRGTDLLDRIDAEGMPVVGVVGPAIGVQSARLGEKEIQSGGRGGLTRPDLRAGVGLAYGLGG